MEHQQASPIDWAATQCHGFAPARTDSDDYHGPDNSGNCSLQPLGDEGAAVLVFFDFAPGCNGLTRAGEQFWPADIHIDGASIGGHMVDRCHFSPMQCARWQEAIAAELTTEVRDARAEAQLRKAGVL